MGTFGISGDDAFKYLNSVNSGNIGKTKASAGAAETSKVSQNTPIDFKTTVDTKDFNLTVDNLSGRVKANAPESQGLASAEDIQKGKLVSGYHFDNADFGDAKLFALKYSTANTPRIADGTKYASDGVEYATVAAHLQCKDNPYADLYA